MLEVPAMICFVLSTIIGGINGYIRSTPTLERKPVRNGHVPPLLVGLVSVPAPLIYMFWRARSVNALPVDLTFLPIAILCLVASLVLIRWDPMQRTGPAQRRAAMKAKMGAKPGTKAGARPQGQH